MTKLFLKNIQKIIVLFVSLCIIIVVNKLRDSFQVKLNIIQGEARHMLVEEQLENARKQVERQIKMALVQKSMTQAELAEEIGEVRQNVNKAVRGGTLPKDQKVRIKIYKALGIK